MHDYDLTVTWGPTLIAGILFGLALAAPPGPMNAIIAEESVIRGWTAGFKAGLGAMTADVAFFLLALAGVVAIVDRVPTLRGLMMGIGGSLMLYFAYGALRNASASFRPDEQITDDAKGFWKALVLALTNPYQILFWLTIGVGLLQPGELDVFSHVAVGRLADLAGTVVVQTGSPTLLIGFFGGILLWIVAFPAALVSAERRIDTLAPIIAVISAIILAGFGLVFLADAIGYVG